MHIGICRPRSPRYPIPDVDGAAIAQHAENVGFESVFYGEHAVRPVRRTAGFSVHTDGVPLFQDLLVMLARASAMTTRITLGGGVFVMPQHQPVRLAKHLSSLDQYADGRLVVGIGVGWDPVETAALGGSFHRRWDRTAEAVHIMRGLWSNESFSFTGKFFEVPPVQCFPRPKAQPGPPILLGARGRATIERVAAYGDGWLPAFVTPRDADGAAAEVRSGRAALDRAAAHTGRQTPYNITVVTRGGPGVRDRLRHLEEAGADRVLISLPVVESLDEAKDSLETIAAEALLPL